MTGASGPYNAAVTDELGRKLQAALGADYVVERPLGEGGFAIVYATSDKKLGRRVAVKVLRPELTISHGAKQRFIREAESAARLNHPHILPIFFVGEGEGLVYFGMPLVDGESLDARLRRTGRLAEPEAARIAAEIADALAEAHAAGLVHRDIKPQNVMLHGTRGRVLVTDFGIAKAAAASSGESEKLTHTGVVIGSPHYMSPEQAGGTGLVDHRSDLYSLGIVLWQMLAGVVPFDSAESQAVLMKQVTQAVPPIRGKRPDVSAAMAAVVEKCTAKKPEDRYQTADEMSAALRVLAAGAAPAPSRRAFAATIAALLAVTALAVAFLLRYPRQTAGADAGDADIAQVQSAAPMIAVLPFTVVTAQDTSQFARSLAGLFAEALAQRNGVATVDANNLLGLWNADGRRIGAPLDSSARFAYGMGANQMILGNYVESGRQFRLTVSMYDTHDLSRLWRDDATGPTDSLFSLVDRLASRAAAALCGQPEYNPSQLCFDVAARPADSVSVTVADAADGGPAAVSFYARVTPDGQLADVRFRGEEADEEIAGRALAALRTARFEPARKAGQAVEAWTTVDVPVLVMGSAAAAAGTVADARCADAPFGTRNENRICYDERPVPVANLPVVRAPVACSGVPTPATVLLQVAETGEVASAPALTSPSSCPAFDSAATAAAAQIVFTPALKDGAPVTAWTYVRVVPAPPATAAAPRPRRVS
jgi:TolB-like protein